MTISGDLNTEFEIYWDNMNRCRNAGAYWALLHVTVCLPDICAALQSNDGETSSQRYIRWCNMYISDPHLDGSELYGMRCRVLHQGRATAKNSSRYAGFAFTEPAPTGQVYHKVVEGSMLVLDVDELSQEIRKSVEQWIHYLETNPTSQEASNTRSNLTSLVKTRKFRMPPPSGPTTGGDIINRSS
jgi:hypothetical protein